MLKSQMEVPSNLKDETNPFLSISVTNSEAEEIGNKIFIWTRTKVMRNLMTWKEFEKTLFETSSYVSCLLYIFLKIVFKKVFEKNTN